MEGYTSRIREASFEMTARDKVKYKDVSDCISLDEVTQTEPVTIDFRDYIIVDIHNDRAKSENKDYVKYIIVDKNGEKYGTGSNSFWSAFMEIYEEMIDAGEKDFQIKVFRRPSKNYAGKDFITCTLI